MAINIRLDGFQILIPEAIKRKLPPLLIFEAHNLIHPIGEIVPILARAQDDED